MKETGNYLFVYGTLLDESNEFGIYLKENCGYYSKGKFRGRLYDLVEYPGAILDKNGSNYVRGSILELKNVTEVLIQLDDYEGFGEDQEQPNLFIREMVEVDTDDGFLSCWVYLYNLPVEGCTWIDSGDYKEYKKRGKSA
jgi:gamma-glutamylcyclotransferase (GGCT)/AIG2-like uncharacterized protein YtfP